VINLTTKFEGFPSSGGVELGLGDLLLRCAVSQKQCEMYESMSQLITSYNMKS